MTVANLIVVVLLLLIPRGVCYAANESALLPIEAFANLPRVSSVKFSPSGKYLAVLRNEDGMTYLTTQLGSGADPHVVVNSDNSEYFIQDYRWVNDERLLVVVRFGSSRKRVESVETRLMAVNRDGTDANPSLISPRRDALLADHYSQFQDGIIGRVLGDAKHVLIALDKENANIPNVYQLDVYSGGLTLVQANPGNRAGIRAIRYWIADRQGRVRAGISDSKTMRRIMIRRKGSDQWQEFVEFDRTKERESFHWDSMRIPTFSMCVASMRVGGRSFRSIWNSRMLRGSSSPLTHIWISTESCCTQTGFERSSAWRIRSDRGPICIGMRAFNGCTRASTGCCQVGIPVSSAAPKTASGMSSSVSVPCTRCNTMCLTANITAF
jgi:hypothetical protein